MIHGRAALREYARLPGGYPSARQRQQWERSLLTRRRLPELPEIQAGVTIVNVNGPARVAGASYSGSFIIGATGPNVCAIASIAWDDATGGLSVAANTLGGTAMKACGAKVEGSSGGSFVAVQHFYLLNPPA